jgi:hypothetical protein
MVTRVSDPVECQDKAREFETHFSQDRYPVPVDHLQGTETWGCDIVSFASEVEAELFKKTCDEKLVERFIEVKGSTSEHGVIELKGNELAAAQRWRDRYYLYRVYKSAPGEYELRLLRDPLSAHKLSLVYQVDLSRDEETDYWHISDQVATSEHIEPA